MEAKELRIGNKIMRHGLVVTTDEQTFWDIKNHPEQYEPIPITEDWMIRLGFKRLGKDTFYLGSVKIHHRKRGFVLAKRYRDLIYVHELQNLYYALTKEELQIQEK